MSNTLYMIYLTMDSKMYESMLNQEWWLESEEFIDCKYDEDLDLYTGLYAWTVSKKFKKKFLEQRNDGLFIVKKIEDEDRSLIEELKEHANGKELFINSFFISDLENSSNSNKVDIVITNNEYYVVSEEFPQYYMEILDLSPVIDYNYFTKEVIDLLDLISYTSWFADYASIEPDFESYQASYGLTMNGNALHVIGENDLATFLWLFKALFK